MTVTHLATAVEEAEASKFPVITLLEMYWSAFQGWRERARARATLHAMSDRQLRDIGLTRGEIDFVLAESAHRRMRARF
jgi:uncharacterized protein YjiS (DUF1127 family)